MSIRKGTTSIASETRTLRVGDLAPEFELSSHRGGEVFRLSDARGRRNLVLAFYPLDWTPV